MYIWEAEVEKFARQIVDSGRLGGGPSVEAPGHNADAGKMVEGGVE